MAVVPVSGTNIRLLSGVPFSHDYKHTRWFDSLADQTAYFTARTVVHRMAEANFQRDKDQTYVRVDASIDELRNVNYLMFQNATYNSKWFYAFVTRLEYVRKEVTYVHFRLDVLQTWRFQLTVNPSFVVREHCPLWNSDGSPVINTIDEGLDYGSEYDNVATYQYVPNGGYKWLVIVAKEALHGSSSAVTPTVIGAPQPLSYYITPFKDSDLTPLVSLPGMEEPSPITMPTAIMEQLYKSETAVNNIVSLYVTDYTGIPVSYQAGSGGGSDILTFTDSSFELEYVNIGNSSIYTVYVGKAADFKPLYHEAYPDKYSAFTRPTESKLLMYPYTQIVMDDFKGNRMVYRPEYIGTDSLNVIVKGSLGTSNKVSYGIPDYNHSSNDGQKALTSNETALINGNPSDVPIINDYLTAYLQGNRNSIENTKNSIVWNMLFDSIGSVAAGNVAGVASNIGNGAANTVLTVQALEAKQKDIQNTPPQIAKMGSNTAYDIGNNYNGVIFIKKQIKPEYQRILSDFFHMYGYKVNRVKVPNFHTRQNWNYVQTLDCHITGNFNTEDLNELQSIFDNGITLWHTNDVGNYALTNEVIS